MLKRSPELNERVIALLATSLDMTPEEVTIRMQKPWGLLQAMKGEWPNFRLERQQAATEGRLTAALQVIRLAEVFGQKDPQFVRETLKRLIIEGGGESPDA